MCYAVTHWFAHVSFRMGNSANSIDSEFATPGHQGMYQRLSLPEQNGILKGQCA